MTFVQITIFILVAVLSRWLIPSRWQRPTYCVASLLMVGWLFASLMSNLSAAIFYVLTVGITILVWQITGNREENLPKSKSRLAVGLVFFSQVVAVSILILNHQLDQFSLVAVAMAGILILVVTRLIDNTDIDGQSQGRIAYSFIVGLVVIFVVLKTPALVSYWGLVFDSYADELTSHASLIWLGFSYFAFRLMAVLLDFAAGRFPAGGYNVQDFITYVLFFPSYTAGPIDRAQRFIPELQENNQLTSRRLVEGLGRILIGSVKKFVIADTLALVSLNSHLVESTTSVAGLWVLVYGYAFQIYFDFSGYSDIAIGIGTLLGIKLPENFDQPYLRPNIQQFWQNWHITLSTWFRIYFFTPFTRFLIQCEVKLPQWLIVFSAQIGTMTLIGLWHGITPNFVVWGLWHGIGLFLFKVISDNTRGWHRRMTQNRIQRQLFYGTSVFVTFHFVVLGWVFFALSDVQLGLRTLIRLFGVGGL